MVMSFGTSFIVLWCYLQYVNKLHIRERGRILGKKIHTHQFIRRYLIKQYVVILDFFAGICDGCLNEDHNVIILTDNHNNNTQTNIIETKDVCTNVDKNLINNNTFTQTKYISTLDNYAQTVMNIPVVEELKNEPEKIYKNKIKIVKK